MPVTREPAASTLSPWKASYTPDFFRLPTADHPRSPQAIEAKQLLERVTQHLLDLAERDIPPSNTGPMNFATRTGVMALRHPDEYREWDKTITRMLDDLQRIGRPDPAEAAHSRDAHDMNALPYPGLPVLRERMRPFLPDTMQAQAGSEFPYVDDMVLHGGRLLFELHHHWMQIEQLPADQSSAQRRANLHLLMQKLSLDLTLAQCNPGVLNALEETVRQANALNGDMPLHGLLHTLFFQTLSDLTIRLFNPSQRTWLLSQRENAQLGSIPWFNGLPPGNETHAVKALLSSMSEDLPVAGQNYADPYAARIGRNDQAHTAYQKILALRVWLQDGVLNPFQIITAFSTELLGDLEKAVRTLKANTAGTEETQQQLYRLLSERLKSISLKIGLEVPLGTIARLTHDGDLRLCESPVQAMSEFLAVYASEMNWLKPWSTYRMRISDDSDVTVALFHHHAAIRFNGLDEHAAAHAEKVEPLMRSLCALKALELEDGLLLKLLSPSFSEAVMYKLIHSLWLIQSSTFAIEPQLLRSCVPGVERLDSAAGAAFHHWDWDITLLCTLLQAQHKPDKLAQAWTLLTHEKCRPLLHELFRMDCHSMCSALLDWKTSEIPSRQSVLANTERILKAAGLIPSDWSCVHRVAYFSNGTIDWVSTKSSMSQALTIAIAQQLQLPITEKFNQGELFRNAQDANSTALIELNGHFYADTDFRNPDSLWLSTLTEHLRSGNNALISRNHFNREEKNWRQGVDFFGHLLLSGLFSDAAGKVDLCMSVFAEEFNTLLHGSRNSDAHRQLWHALLSDHNHMFFRQLCTQHFISYKSTHPPLSIPTPGKSLLIYCAKHGGKKAVEFLCEAGSPVKNTGLLLPRKLADILALALEKSPLQFTSEERTALIESWRLSC